jgi:hypothetical protein
MAISPAALPPTSCAPTRGEATPGPKATWAGAGRTVPATGSTSTRAPSAIRSRASATPRTAGMPSSRAAIPAWPIGPPWAVTRAPAMGRTQLNAGVVVEVTSTSPGRSRVMASSGSTATTARPRWTVRPTPTPVPPSAGPWASMVPRKAAMAVAVRRRPAGKTAGSGGGCGVPRTAGGSPAAASSCRAAARAARTAAPGAPGAPVRRAVTSVVVASRTWSGSDRSPASCRRAPAASRARRTRPSGHMQLIPAWSSRDATARRASSRTSSPGVASPPTSLRRAPAIVRSTTSGSSTRRRPVTSKAPTTRWPYSSR